MPDNDQNPYASPLSSESQPNPFGPGYVGPHRGGWILTFGILSILLCPFVGIPTWILANQDLNKMNNGQMDPNGRTLTQVGKILSIISLVFVVLQFLLILGLLAFEIMQ